MIAAVGKCSVCGKGFDRSAITDSYLITGGGRAVPLVYSGVGSEAGMHLHDVLIADRALATWRGFIRYKTTRVRYKIRKLFRGDVMSRPTKRDHIAAETAAGRSIPLWRFFAAYLMVLVAFTSGRVIQAGHEVLSTAGIDTGAWSAFWWINLAAITIPAWACWLLLMKYVRTPRRMS